MMNLYQKTKKNEKGFTLVELMVVVVIIGILVAIAIPVYNSSQQKAKEKAHAANVRIIEGAIETYRMEEGGITDLGGEISGKHPLLGDEKYLKDPPEYPLAGGDDDKYYSIQIESDGTYEVKPPVEEEN